MNKLTHAAISFLFLLSLCSCNYVIGSQIEPIKSEVTEFDLLEAKSIIESEVGEKLIADISTKDAVTRQEFDAFLSAMHNEYNDNSPWALMFFYNTEFEDESVNTLHLTKNMFYPTIYHEDIEIVSANVTHTYYEDETLDLVILTIRVEYTGTDSNLKGWYRENMYRKIDNTWVFDNFGGSQLNFLGDEFTQDYLKLKNTITFDDQRQVEQLITTYFSALENKSYLEAWQLTSYEQQGYYPKTHALNEHWGLDSIKLVSCHGILSPSLSETGEVLLNIPTILFLVKLDILPVAGTAWDEGINERFVMVTKDDDGRWKIDGLATSP